MSDTPRKMNLNDKGNIKIETVDDIITDLEILSQVSKETTWEEVRALDLKDRLIEAGKHGWTGGCGLSAIQIGIPLRYAVYLYKQGLYELLNPTITGRIGSYEVKEGCLSIPDTWIHHKRAFQIEYISDGKKHKAKGFRAQIIQHEIDHMDGKLIKGESCNQNS